MNPTIQNQISCLQKICSLTETFIKNFFQSNHQQISQFRQKREYLYDVFLALEKKSPEINEGLLEINQLVEKLAGLDEKLSRLYRQEKKATKNQLISTANGFKTIKQYRLNKPTYAKFYQKV